MIEVESLMREFLSEDMANYLSLIPAGKQLRSRLICAIAPQSEKRFLLSAIIEMLHLASLLHDDVIDDAKTRRGVPSLFASEGSKTAVMVGDIFYATAFTKLVGLGETVASIVAESVAKLSRGEMMDTKLATAFNSDRALYEEMIYLKTASLIEASCATAAQIAGKDRARYAEFGRKLGVAFQVIDDLLDITQDEATLGKPALNDISEGKVTLPLIALFTNGDATTRERLLALFGKRVVGDDAVWLKAALAKSGALEESQTYANRLLVEAKALIDGETELLALADKLVCRIS
ncbi:octaprenyl-diphosphate synthase [Campylobacterota bacterium]|nr:octaprenyl-diphosphate synthase [Campylobacterota bacterium]